ncbi:MAG: filamin/ABP280 repeat domain-containing protein, partial [Longimicrobiales bacterium]
MRHRFLTATVSSVIAVALHSCTMRDITEVPVVTVEVQPSTVTVLEGGARQLTARARDGLGKELPSGAVTWASDASDVFSIDATGWGEGLAIGTATVWATLDGIRGSATVSVEPGPRLVVQAPQLQFFLDLARVAPETLTLEITNGGGGGIGGISATAHYPEGGASGWLSLSLSTTSAPSTLTVSVPSGLLEEGVHEATIVLASDDALNSPISVPVQAVVTQNQPIIQLSPRVIEFQAEATGGPPPPLTVQVTNTGGGDLSGLEAMPLYLDVGNWLWTSLTGTTAPAELLIQPDPDGLEPGTYFAEVRVIGPEALNTPQSLSVTFTVTPGPASPAHSTATVPDGSAGLATSILLRTRDELGNPLTSGGDTVVVRVSGANDIGALDVSDQGDGTYTASYTPTTAGTDLVAITINHTPVHDSPFTSRVSAGPATPGQSTATVPDGTLGLSTKIVVQARDAYGNRVESGGETVVVTVSGANDAGALTV